MKYEENDFCVRCCYDCEQKDQIVNDISHWFEGVIDHIYGVEELDEFELESCLDQICKLIGLKLPETAPTLMRKPKVKESLHPIKKTFDLNAWVDWNQNFLKEQCSQLEAS